MNISIKYIEIFLLNILRYFKKIYIQKVFSVIIMRKVWKIFHFKSSNDHD